MKVFYCEAQYKQLEKPTEPLYLYNMAHKCKVFAESEAEALELAEKKLHAAHDGTGVWLGKVVITKSAQLPVDWSYGYGEERRSGCTCKIGDLVGSSVIR